MHELHELHEPLFNVETHASTTDAQLSVISITGIDVTEKADAYTVYDLRAIARRLLNTADHLEYLNNSASTKPLFEMRV